MTKPLLVSSGEPAGIGPDLCIQAASGNESLVILGDKFVLDERAKKLGLSLQFRDYEPKLNLKSDEIAVLQISCPASVTPGILNVDNAAYVLEILTQGMERCLKGEFSGLVTAPVHKGIINQANFNFTGHTEFFAEHCRIDQVVMLLVCPEMKVALVTTHLPLKNVSEHISETLLINVIKCLHTGLQKDFGIQNPQIRVAGLNPHAGENGYLGREEIEVVIPALNKLKAQGLSVHGPYAADTMFAQYREENDVFLTMYHDQGLPVLKYAGFGEAANVTLGLPFIRTSVDHGTALELAGTGKAKVGSLRAAINVAAFLANRKCLNEQN